MSNDEVICDFRVAPIIRRAAQLSVLLSMLVTCALAQREPTYLFHGQQIQCWGGPGQGTITTDGAHWVPYQPATFPTPPFPEYISGHSTFSAAGATILALWTGSEQFGASVTFASGSSVIEPDISPKSAVTLHWKTFHDAANQAGISRRYGGIHFRAADLVGRATGDLVAANAWAKARQFFGDKAEQEH